MAEITEIFRFRVIDDSGHVHAESGDIRRARFILQDLRDRYYHDIEDNQLHIWIERSTWIIETYGEAKATEVMISDWKEAQ